MVGTFRKFGASAFFALVAASCLGGSDGDTPLPPTPNPPVIGMGCTDTSQCGMLICLRGGCFSPSATNGLKDGDESDVDCGGASAPKCEDGKACAGATDCTSVVCTTAICQVPTHTDAVKNGDEVDVDCGGPTAPKCGRGLHCNASSDCDNVLCKEGVCGSPEHVDGLKNSDETGIDCGGPGDAKRCPPGQGCAGDGDCDKTRCDTGTKLCKPASPTDGLKNADETDLDCGGAAAPKCALKKTCGVDGDCTSGACNYAKTCVSTKSCKPHFGGDTCGTGEVGQGGAVHEDCCTVLTTATAAKVDKYLITAGRVRAMLEAVSYDVQGWWQANKNNPAAVQPAAKNQLEPYMGVAIQGPLAAGAVGGTVRLPSGAPDGYPEGAYYYLGSTNYYATPMGLQGCYAGNFVNQAYGAHTYDNPPGPKYGMACTSDTDCAGYACVATAAAGANKKCAGFEQEVRGVPREQLDTLPINCIPYPLMVAFCAWDGGHLATVADFAAAYGSGRFPWGATPIPAATNPFGYGGPRGPSDMQGTMAPYYTACTDNATTCNRDVTNFGYDYQYPVGGYPAAPWDYAFYISPPGRFAIDRSPYGHADLGGDMLEWVGDLHMAATPTTNAAMKMGIAASWEGHGATGNPNTKGTGSYPIMAKYGKISGRCAR